VKDDHHTTRADHFRYSDDEWAAIEAFLSVRKISTTLDDRSALEAIVQNFVFLANRTDPRTDSVKAAKRHWARIATSAETVITEIEKLEALETRPLASLHIMLADNPLAQVAEFAAFRRKLAALAKYAESATRGHLKSYVGSTIDGKLIVKAGPNRARGELVDRLFRDLLTFWKSRGGHVGRNSTSPSTKFVEVVASRALSIIPDVKLPWAITDFVRQGGCI
jgi:hypothetical protein